MKKNYKLKVHFWSKQFVSLLPLTQNRHGDFVHLPRFMCQYGRLPRFVRLCPTTMSIIPAFRLLAWDMLPVQTSRHCFGKLPVPQVAYIAAFLLKIDQQLPSIGHLRRFLLQHPALIWALGFPLWPVFNIRVIYCHLISQNLG